MVEEQYTPCIKHNCVEVSEPVDVTSDKVKFITSFTSIVIKRQLQNLFPWAYAWLTCALVSEQETGG